LGEPYVPEAGNDAPGTTTVTLTVKLRPLVIELGDFKFVNTDALTPMFSTSAPYSIASPYTERAVSFTITVSGLADSDTAAVGLDPIAAGASGLSLSANTGGNTARNVTLTYNGTAEVATTGALRLALTINNSNYAICDSGDTAVDIIVIDGQHADRAIPVTQANIRAFNTYANSAEGLWRHYKLTEDIDLTPVAPVVRSWDRIGSGINSGINNDNRFTGSFDGRGYIITNLTIDSAVADQGLFGVIGSGGAVRNLGLTNVNISGADTSAQRFGGIAGHLISGAAVSNSFVIGNIAGDTQIGGVVGFNSGTVENCYAGGSVSATGMISHVGGLVGNNNGMVRNSYAACDVSGSNNVGGVAGNNNGTVENCYAVGSVTGSGENIGGIVGINNNARAVRNSVALNPSITTIRTAVGSLGRVTGNTGGTRANNHARNDMNIRHSMNVGGGVSKTPVEGLTAADGAGINAALWYSEYWWRNTALFDHAVWYIADDSLPMLINVGGTQPPAVPPVPTSASFALPFSIDLSDSGEEMPPSKENDFYIAPKEDEEDDDIDIPH